MFPTKIPKQNNTMIIKYSFQKASCDDEVAIFNLYVSVMKKYISEIWGWNQEWQKNDFRRHFNPESITVVKEKKTIIGYSQVEKQGSHLYVRMMLLLPEYQGMGIGSHLLNSVIEEANIQSMIVGLEVFKINERALGFYKHHGFQIQGETQSSFKLVFTPK